MAEQSSPQHQHAHFAETLAGLSPGSVELTRLDPDQIGRQTFEIVSDMERQTGETYDVYPGTVQGLLLPMRGTEKGERAGFVVAEGSGVLEVVSGKRGREEALRQNVEPGTVLLAHVDPDMAKTPWLRADSQNEDPLKGYFIVSRNTRLALDDEANKALIMGAGARRHAGERMQHIASRKLRALGRLGTNNS